MRTRPSSGWKAHRPENSGRMKCEAGGDGSTLCNLGVLGEQIFSRAGLESWRWPAPLLAKHSLLNAGHEMCGYSAGHKFRRRIFLITRLSPANYSKVTQ